jgi:prepilin-type N-terminal cleavage/methylation domain-containing protein
MKTLKGFSLIETIVAIAITGILAGIIAGLLSRGFSNYFLAQSLNQDTTVNQIALTRISKELKKAIAFNQALASNVSFTTYDDDIIEYSITSNTLYRRQNGGTLYPLLTATSALSFSYANSSFNPTAILNQIRLINISITSSVSGNNFVVLTSTYVRNLY